MSNYSKIYWFTRLDAFSSIIISIGAIGLTIAFVLIMHAFVFSDKNMIYSDRDGSQAKEIDNRRAYCRKKVKWIIPLSIMFFIINAFIPSKNEALLIMAGGKTLDYVQSDSSLSKIPYQTTAIISSFLEKQLKEMKSEDKKVK